MDIAQFLALLSDPEFALAVVGGGSAVAALLRNILPYLEDFASRTPTDADNVAVAWLSNALRLFTALLDAAKKLADAVGLNPPAPRAWQESGADEASKGEK